MVRLLAALVLMLAVAQHVLAQTDWKQELKKDLVTVSDGKMVSLAKCTRIRGGTPSSHARRSMGPLR